MILLLPGLHKTGTTTMWEGLDKHPQVECSLQKEPSVNFSSIPDYDEDDYYMNWFFKDKTRVIFDATGYHGYEYFLPKIKKFKKIDEIKILFPLRSLVQLWISLIYQHYVVRLFTYELNFGSKNLEDHIEQLILKEDIYSNCLKSLESHVGKENILVFDLENIVNVQNGIYKFLGIDEVKLPFVKENETSMDLDRMTWIQTKYYIKIKSAVNRQKSVLNKKYRSVRKEIKRNFQFLEEVS